ncbi:MAG: hypothetical protein AB7K09_22290 [Planctomycetota bacterium]
MNPIDDNHGTGQQEQEHVVHLTLSLDGLEAIDLISLFQLACDQGQYGDADVIRTALIRSMDEYRAGSELPAEEEEDEEERGF